MLLPKYQVIEDTITDMENGRAAYFKPEFDQYDRDEYDEWLRNCREFTRELYSWRELRLKYHELRKKVDKEREKGDYKLSEKDQEFRKEYVKSTNSMYLKIIHWRSLGKLIIPKGQELSKVVVTLLDKIENQEDQIKELRSDNQKMARLLAKDNKTVEPQQSAPNKDFKGFG
jgi:hypothetical protein